MTSIYFLKSFLVSYRGLSLWAVTGVSHFVEVKGCPKGVVIKLSILFSIVWLRAFDRGRIDLLGDVISRDKA